MVALSALLASPALGLTLVQAGPSDPSLNWVSVTELLDLGRYLDEPNEVILTTGLALRSDDPRWHDFVAGLSRARVAAIGFGTGVIHDRIPQPLVQAASLHRVALFEVPPPTPFIAVSKAAAELLRADELRGAQRALVETQHILDASRGDQTPAELLSRLAQSTGKHLAVIGSDGEVIASTAGYAQAARAQTDRVALDARGALQLSVAGAEPLTPSGRSIITAGAIVLGMALRDDRAAEARERARWERLTAGLMDGSQSTEAATLLEPDIVLPAHIRAVAVQGAAEDIAGWRRQARTGLDRLVTVAPEPPDHRSGLRHAWQLVADNDTALTRSLHTAVQHGLDAIVGRPAAISQAALSARSARSRLGSLSPTAALYAAPRTPQVIWCDRESPLLDALLDLTGRGELSGATALGPLSYNTTPEEAPADRDTLRATLRALFVADGHRGPTAAALGVHRNTLRDRIRRVETLTQRSLENPDDRAELWLALRIEELTE